MSLSIWSKIIEKLTKEPWKGIPCPAESVNMNSRVLNVWRLQSRKSLVTIELLKII